MRNLKESRIKLKLSQRFKISICVIIRANEEVQGVDFSWNFESMFKKVLISFLLDLVTTNQG